MPKFDFKNLFTNKKDFPDDFQITLANGAVVSVGDLREYNTQTGGELAREFKAREADLNKRAQTVDAATERVAHIITELQAGRLPAEAAELGITLPKGSKSNNGGGGGDLDALGELANDPLIKPILDRLTALQHTVDEFKSKDFATLQRSVGQASLAFINRELGRTYDTLPFKELGDKVDDSLSLQSLTRYAVENNLMTRDKLPDIQGAFDKVAGPKLIEKRLKEAEERGYKRRDAEVASEMPLPGSGGGRMNLGEPTGPKPIDTKGKRAEQILSEQLAAAAKDKDLWRGIAGLPT